MQSESEPEGGKRGTPFILSSLPSIISFFTRNQISRFKRSLDSLDYQIIHLNEINSRLQLIAKSFANCIIDDSWVIARQTPNNTGLQLKGYLPLGLLPCWGLCFRHRHSANQLEKNKLKRSWRTHLATATATPIFTFDFPCSCRDLTLLSLFSIYMSTFSTQEYPFQCEIKKHRDSRKEKV